LLLTAAAFINYIDRGNLATAGPLIRDQLGLTSTQLGLLLSAFFWSYAPAQLPAGWLTDRFDARLVLAIGLGIWGGATALTGLASSFAPLLLLRLMLGVGESAMYPACFKILARAASERQRGRANGFVASGQLLGPAFGTLVGGLLMVWLGWRVVFVVFGCLSLMWLWPWLRTPAVAAPDGSSTAEKRTVGDPPTLTIICRRELWGSCLGQLCFTYTLYLVLSWLPVYLVQAHGVSMARMAQIGAGIYALSAITSIATGWVSDRALTAGAGTNRVRKCALLLGLGVMALCLMACALAHGVGALIAMCGCAVGIGIALPGIFASVQTLAGPYAVGRWYGVQNFVGNLSGISAPVITGMLVDRTGSFSAGFVIAALVAVAGMIAYGLAVRRIEPIQWHAVRTVDATVALQAD
jgi:MFS family permease